MPVLTTTTKIISTSTVDSADKWFSMSFHEMFIVVLEWIMPILGVIVSALVIKARKYLERKAIDLSTWWSNKKLNKHELSTPAIVTMNTATANDHSLL